MIATLWKHVCTVLWILGMFVTTSSVSAALTPVTVTVSVTYQDGTAAADVPIVVMRAGGRVFRDGQMRNTDANGLVAYQLEVDDAIPYILTFLAGPGHGMGLEGQVLIDWQSDAESIMKAYSPSPVVSVTKLLDGISQYDVTMVLRDAVSVTVSLVDEANSPVSGGFLIGASSRDMDFNRRADDSALTIGGVPKGVSSEIFILAGNAPTIRVWSLRLTSQQTQTDITLPPVIVVDYDPGDACLQLIADGRSALRTLGIDAAADAVTLLAVDTSDLFSLPVEVQSGAVQDSEGGDSPCVPSGLYYPIPGLPGGYGYVRLRDALDRGVDVQSFGVPLLEFVPGQNPPIELDMKQIEDAIVAAYES